MSDTPLYTALINHKKCNRASFHTPGHKCAAGALPQDLLKLDFTELPDTDSLFEADGAILQAEQKASALFGTKRTLISSGGCTLCIQAMLRLAAPNGGKIIAGRVIHRSAVNSMALLDLQPVWVLPRQNAGVSLAGRICAEDIADALRKNPDAKAVYLTSPDYFGVLSDISAISNVCRQYGVPLLVDNAHGAHLMFTTQNLHPITLGASMTACSAHKTLPVLTGGAWLNIADTRFADNAKDAMALFGSTSPSYPIMASLDLSRAWLSEHGAQAYRKLEGTVAEIKHLAANCGIQLPQGIVDPTRITLNTASIGMTGTSAAELFRKRGVEPEYADASHVVLIATPFNTEADFDCLSAAIQALPTAPSLPDHPALPPLPTMNVSPRQAIFGGWEQVELHKAKGRIAAQAACPCPPGVPVVMPGEILTKEVIDFLLGYGFFAIKVLK